MSTQTELAIVYGLHFETVPPNPELYLAGFDHLVELALCGTDAEHTWVLYDRDSRRTAEYGPLLLVDCFDETPSLAALKAVGWLLKHPDCEPQWMVFGARF